LTNELLAESKSTSKRYILKEGLLLKAPMKPFQLLTTALLFFPEKIKIFLAFRKKFSVWPTISFFDLARNVMGFSAAEYLASPFARGVYGAEAEDLEFAALFPELFKKIASAPKLGQALKEFSIERREYWNRELNGIEFKKGIYSFKGGLRTLLQSLIKNLKENGVEMQSVKIVRIRPEGRGYSLSSKNQTIGTFEKIILATSAMESANLVREFDKELATRLSELTYSPVNVLYAAWDKKNFFHNGYGFLVPRKEKLSIMGTIFASNIFSGRSDENTFLTKTMISGDNVLFKDEELANLSFESHQRIFKSLTAPRWTKVYRHTPGIPRYAKGYGEWKRDVLSMAAQHKNLNFAGWCFSGVGMSDNLEAAYQFAKTTT